MVVRLTIRFAVQPGKRAAFADCAATARVRAEDGGRELYNLFHLIAVRDGMRQFLAGAATVHRYPDRE